MAQVRKFCSSFIRTCFLAPKLVQRYIETRTLHFRFAIQIQQPVVYPLVLPKCNSRKRLKPEFCSSL